MGQRVLLCDDEVHILRAAEFKLKRAGYHVRVAMDGQEAWELIQQGCPDLLVTDYQMPRMDGLALIGRLRLHEPTAQLPVMLLTAKGLEIDQSQLIERYRLTAILCKPFSPRELLARIEQELGPSQSELISLEQH